MIPSSRRAILVVVFFAMALEACSSNTVGTQCEIASLPNEPNSSIQCEPDLPLCVTAGPTPGGPCFSKGSGGLNMSPGPGPDPRTDDVTEDEVPSP